MGMTKAIQERVYIQGNMRRPETRFICVRYGNVLASRGSVVPLFLEQIAAGGPVTITTPDMTRFLLTLDDAVDTIFAAVRSAAPGETYIPRVPSARIVDVAEALIAGADIPIVTTGIRPGEKIHEILISDEESYRTVHGAEGYYALRPMLPEVAGDLAVEPVLKAEYSSADNLMAASEVVGYLADACAGGRRRVLSGSVTGDMKVITILGTRPEIIRLRCVIDVLDDSCDHLLVHTGQNFDHRLSQLFFDELRPARAGLPPGGARGRLRGADRPDRLASRSPVRRAAAGRAPRARRHQLGTEPRVVAKRMGISVFHMEAGNRCYDDRVPEEVNRRVIDHSSSVLMPYTHRSAANLVREGIERRRVFVTGNPIKEVLDRYADRIAASHCAAGPRARPRADSCSPPSIARRPSTSSRGSALWPPRSKLSSPTTTCRSCARCIRERPIG